MDSILYHCLFHVFQNPHAKSPVDETVHAVCLLLLPSGRSRGLSTDVGNRTCAVWSSGCGETSGLVSGCVSDDPSASGDGWNSYGRFYGYFGCKAFLWGTGEKACDSQRPA